MSARNDPVIITGGDWMRDKEKRMQHMESRRVPQQASDLMGPGLAAFGIGLADWSDPVAVFNGIFHSVPGALNAPDALNYFIGTVTSNADGYGIQLAREYRTGVDQPQDEWIREFAPGASGPVFTDWALAATGEVDTGWLAITFNAGYVQNDATTGACQIRRIGDLVHMRGLVKPSVGTFGAGAAVSPCTLDAQFRPTLVQEIWVAGVGSTTADQARCILTPAGAVTVAPSNAATFISLAHTWLIN